MKQGDAIPGLEVAAEVAVRAGGETPARWSRPHGPDPRAQKIMHNLLERAGCRASP